MRRQVADHLVVVMKRSNVRGAKGGVVIPRWNVMGQLETGGARRFWWRAAALRDGTSRVDGRLSSTDLWGAGDEILRAYSAQALELLDQATSPEIGGREVFHPALPGNSRLSHSETRRTSSLKECVKEVMLEKRLQSWPQRSCPNCYRDPLGSYLS